MTEHASSNEPASGRVLTIGEASVPPGSKLASQRFAEDLTSIGVAIAFAGSAFPVVVAMGSFIVAFASYGSDVLTLNELGDALSAIIAFGLFGAIIGLFWTGIVAFAIFPLVYVFVRSLGLNVSLVPFGAFCGGLVGVAAIMPIVGIIALEADSAGVFLILMVGPALTTVVGQIGGAWGASRIRREPVVGSPLPSARYQFGTRHLMMACVWVALLLTAIRLSGLDFLAVIVLSLGWLVYQATTIWIVGLGAKWFGSWKGRRQTRST